MIDDKLNDLIRRTTYHTVFIDEAGKNWIISKLVVKLPVQGSYDSTSTLFAVASVDGSVGAVESAMQQAVFGFCRQLSPLIVSTRSWRLPVYAFDAETGLPNLVEEVDVVLDRTRLVFPRRTELEGGSYGLAFLEYQS